jgi:RimJ/RimL family protein N-acetyltransferase
MIKINVYSSSKELLDSHESFLLENKLLNNLILGILYRLKNEEKKPNELFMAIENNKEKLILCMSGLYIILYANTHNHEIYEEAVHYLDDNQIIYPGIIGPVEICNLFLIAYHKIKHQDMKLLMNQRIYVNTKVNKTNDSHTDLYLAEETDQELLYDWYFDFYKCTGESISFKDAKIKVNEMIKLKNVYVLKYQGEIVSMAGKSRPFLDSVTVGYVYTPPEYRYKGYATKCVELLTEHLLKTYRSCTLYTDLSNPTSNSIYQKIGYIPIGDSCVYSKNTIK